MRKQIIFPILIISVMLLTGCMGSVQMEDRNYVMAMGIDYNVNLEEITVSLSFPDLKALTGEGDNIHYPAVSLMGHNLKEIEDSYHQCSNKRLDFGQLQVIVFGQDLLEHKDALESILSYMKNHQAFTRTTYVCAAKNKAEEIMALDASVNGSIGIYIRDMFENNWFMYGYEKTTLNDLIVVGANRGETVTLAVLSSNNETPSVSGTKNIKFTTGL